jgi:hypothetical protein
MYPKWGNARVTPQLGGGHGIEKKYVLSNTQEPQHHTGRNNSNGLGKKAATQSDMGVDQGESSGWASEVEAFD